MVPFRHKQEVYVLLKEDTEVINYHVYRILSTDYNRLLTNLRESIMDAVNKMNLLY